MVAREVIPELISRFVDTGMARYVYRDFPLSSHPNAQRASEASACAGLQDSFWEMNEELFAKVDEWSQAEDPTEVFKGYADELGLDQEAFNQCLDGGETAITVRADFMAGETAGVNATPFFFINDIPIRGGLPIDSLGRVIEYAAAGGQTPRIVPELDDPRLRGEPMTAQAITVAFVDFASPESAQHAAEVLPELLEAYVDEGTTLYVLQPWSSTPDGPSAQAAAAAECAGQQEEYWEMHDKLFEEQATWTESDDPGPLFAEYADDLGLDTAAFEECVGSDWAALRVESGSVAGTLVGVPGAPVFLFNNGQGQQGSPTFEEFQTVIDSILGQ
jgi:protein-disulfide isomerase